MEGWRDKGETQKVRLSARLSLRGKQVMQSNGVKSSSVWQLPFQQEYPHPPGSMHIVSYCLVSSVSPACSVCRLLKLFYSCSLIGNSVASRRQYLNRQRTSLYIPTPSWRTPLPPHCVSVTTHCCFLCVSACHASCCLLLLLDGTLSCVRRRKLKIKKCFCLCHIRFLLSLKENCKVCRVPRAEKDKE